MDDAGLAALMEYASAHLPNVRLISPERLRQVSTVAARGPEWVFGQEMAFGLRYAVEDDGSFGAAGSGAASRSRTRSWA